VKNKCCIFEICALNLNTLSKFNFSKATDLAQALKQQLILWMAPSRLPRQSDCKLLLYIITSTTNGITVENDNDNAQHNQSWLWYFCVQYSSVASEHQGLRTDSVANRALARFISWPRSALMPAGVTITRRFNAFTVNIEPCVAACSPLISVIGQVSKCDWDMLCFANCILIYFL